MPKTKRKKQKPPLAVSSNGHNGNGHHAAPPVHSPPDFIGGARLRVSRDDPTSFLSGLVSTVAKRDLAEAWRTGKWDLKSWTKADLETLVDTLCELSPEVSAARWHFLRLENPGFDVKVLPLTGDGEEEIDAGKAVVDAFFMRLRDRHGSENIPLNRALDNLFKRGMMVIELVMDQAGLEGLDLATPDAKTVKFQKKNDPVLGEVHIPYQEAPNAPDGKVLLDRPTIRVVPLDPAPGDPHGTSIVLPSIEPVTFKQGFLQDIRRVVRQQGYPRIGIKLLHDKLKQAMPPEAATDAKTVKAWYEAVIASCKREYEALEPDDAFFHPDWQEMERPIGTLDTSSLGAVPAINELLDTGISRALKVPPLLMGMRFSTTETQANREWEILTNGHQAVQHILENAMEHFLGLLLRAAGIQGRVEFRFSTLRSAEEMRDTQTATLKAALWEQLYLYGFVGQDKAAQEAAGVSKADWPGPRAGEGAVDESGESMASKLMEVEPEPGTKRGRHFPTPSEWNAAFHRALIEEMLPIIERHAAMAAQKRGLTLPEYWAAEELASRLVEILHERAEPVRPPVETLPDLPDAVSVGPEDAAAALEGWDGVMREHVGLLDSEVV